MFRDTQEELDRLNEQLLELTEEASPQEEPPEQPEEELLPEELLDTLLGEGQIQDADYKNHANQYGRIYNADKTERSPQALGDAVLEEPEQEKGVGGLIALALVLLAAILGVLIWLIV